MALTDEEQKTLKKSLFVPYLDQCQINSNDWIVRLVEKKGHIPYVQVVLPRLVALPLIQKLHGDITSGHLGLKKTLERVRQRFFYPGMSRDVRNYVLLCDVCNASKQSKPT